MIYIQRKTKTDLETVDEFETYAEARAMLIEYRIADRLALHYMSNRACSAWKLKEGVCLHRIAKEAT